MTVPYAEVIGDPIAHSKSPLIHGFWLAKLGLAGEYGKTHVRGPELEDFLATRRTDGSWRGCNVTVPHKQAVMPFVDRIDPVAAKIGAVNTIVATGDGLVGHNTDAAGFLEPLRGLLAEPHYYRMARIMGAGGAAKAVAHALAGEGFTIVIAARNPDQAAALCAEIDGVDTHVATLDSFGAPLDFDWGDRSGVLDLFVNATSLGMIGSPPLAVDFSNVPPDAVVYDIVYAPLETALLGEARKRGLRAVDGLDMLIGQAAEAFCLFFGQPAPRTYDAELRALLTA
ncbi:shikimate dehydrogenase [Sphingomonas sp. KC8]|uniref:shikimate dehydrogenase n=1 Tax=Sphingomonas sp. KC8 TaxID=1030157 RepID=UPI000248AAF6|nr:shikimate dehydrogenase [Sphingomonas sp. KC8]ARS28122.1 shikimate 5-dehydrogenase [Sphingomonas sp. KC8]